MPFCVLSGAALVHFVILLTSADSSININIDSSSSNFHRLQPDYLWQATSKDPPAWYQHLLVKVALEEEQRLKRDLEYRQLMIDSRVCREKAEDCMPEEEGKQWIFGKVLRKFDEQVAHARCVQKYCHVTSAN